ncbi:LysR family transcriptional regulator [Marivita sp. GX14005]|uniref:LysR family transcriptional regulator n=1 Tax=Marivita sp. GX14005 TaxID=2942276 RepID=UPI002018ECEF|nr:LysR family transcriptional regulator [Marivita sp. GX14005]MCL3882221.1 LysR family transcriptional regulator [Marivita sp. GX14005]
MTWENLKILLAVHREGSQSKAALFLGMDQSTVARRLSCLEAELGVILFVRTKSGLVLTDAGKIALRHAILIETAAHALAEDMSETAMEGSAGLVRLLGNAWMLNRLADIAMPAFLARHPRLELRLLSLTPRVIARGEASVSLWFEVDPRDGEFAVALGQVPYALYRSRKAPPNTDDWVIFLDEDAAPKTITNAALQMRRPHEKVRLSATDAGILLAAIAGGIGKGLLPMCLAEQDRRLRRVAPGPPELHRTLKLHLHPDTCEMKKVHTVVDWLHSIFPQVFLPAPHSAFYQHPSSASMR